MSIFSRYFRSFSSKLRGATQGRGFTLVELMVVVAIVVVITSLILLRHSRFDSTTLLRSLAYNVALTIRQAQVYGTSVRAFAGTGGFSPGHGVRFTSGQNAEYYFFSDVDGQRDFDAGEIIATPKLNRGFTIKKFCAVNSSGEACSNSAGTIITELVIYFRRPNPDAFFYTTPAGSNYTYAYIELQPSREADVRRVKITNTGQITVCPVADTIANC